MKTPDLIVKIRIPLRDWASVETALEEAKVKIEAIKLEDRSALKALNGQRPGRARMPEEDINRARDLLASGMTAKGVAEKLGYRRLAIQRLAAPKGTYLDVKYTPSEFAPPGIEKWYGKDKFHWLKDVK